MDEKIRFSTEKAAFDIAFVTNFLAKESYWAKDRSRTTVEATIKNSFCIGAFIGSRQIGFGRVVTDYETFAYLMDIFIAAPHRSKGYGYLLVQQLINSKELAKLKKFFLKTTDARPLYLDMGFFDAPEGIMCLDRTTGM